MFFLVKCSLHMLSFLWKAADVLLRVSRWKNKLKHHRFDRKKECTEPMKKSCLIAVITALAAVAGALAAVAVYLHRREKHPPTKIPNSTPISTRPKIPSGIRI